MDYTLIPNDTTTEKLRHLSGLVIYVYIVFRSKLRYRKGSITPVENIVTFTYPEAEQHKIPRKSFDRTIKRLVEVGLIEIIEKGQFGGRRPTYYRVN